MYIKAKSNKGFFLLGDMSSVAATPTESQAYTNMSTKVMSSMSIEDLLATPTTHVIVTPTSTHIAHDFTPIPSEGSNCSKSVCNFHGVCMRSRLCICLRS